MQGEDLGSMTNDELRKAAEEVLHNKCKDQPSTSAQKWRLRKLGVVFDKLIKI